jgi:hypothetical protein
MGQHSRRPVETDDAMPSLGQHRTVDGWPATQVGDTRRRRQAINERGGQISE